MENELISFSLNNSSINYLKNKQLYDVTLKSKNFEEIFKILSNLESLYDNINNSKEKLKEILTKLKKDFNICGILVDLIQVMIHNDSKEFETELKVKNYNNIIGNIVFSIFLKKINKEYAEYLNKLPKNIMMFFLNVKAILSKKDEKYELKFVLKKNSKIIYDLDSLKDVETPLNFNSKISKLYYENLIKEKEKQKEELNRQNLSQLINKTEQDNFIYTNTSKDNIGNINIIDKISDEKIKKLIYENIEKDIEKLLTKKIKKISYSLKSIPDFLQETNYPLRLVDAMGVIFKVKKEPKVTTIEIASLLNSNKMKIIHYPNSWKFQPYERQILLLKNVPIKINQNFEIIIENPLQNSVEVIGLLEKHLYILLKSFRIPLSINFSSLIDLLNPIIYRSIKKYLIIIKDITKITSRYDKEYPSNVIDKFPYLRFFAKCLIDDGSYEAEMNLYDLMAQKILRFNYSQLEKIQENSQTVNNYIIYQKPYGDENIIKKNFMDDIFPKQFICYCVPYSKIANKHFKENKYEKYLGNLGQKNHEIQNKFMNTAFINGDLFYEKDYYTNKNLLTPKPLLKCIYLEEIK